MDKQKKKRRTKSQIDADNKKLASKQKIESVVNAQKLKGAGDIVEKITEATGIKAIVKLFTPEGEDCGCDERKKKMNEAFKFRKKPECLTEDEHTWLTNYFVETSDNTKVKHSTQSEMLKVYNRVMQTGIQPSSCSGCYRDIHQAMKRVYQAY